MAMREQLGKVDEWDSVEKNANPGLSLLAESYLTLVTADQGVPGKQAAPMPAHIDGSSILGRQC